MNIPKRAKKNGTIAPLNSAKKNPSTITKNV
jgi:hypothetical protein